jgi:hypothetical protein
VTKDETVDIFLNLGDICESEHKTMVESCLSKLETCGRMIDRLWMIWRFQFSIQIFMKDILEEQLRYCIGQNLIGREKILRV